jgi:hypothetical protein
MEIQRDIEKTLLNSYNSKQLKLLELENLNRNFITNFWNETILPALKFAKYAMNYDTFVSLYSSILKNTKFDFFITQTEHKIRKNSKIQKLNIIKEENMQQIKLTKGKLNKFLKNLNQLYLKYNKTHLDNQKLKSKFNSINSKKRPGKESSQQQKINWSKQINLLKKKWKQAKYCGNQEISLKDFIFLKKIKYFNKNVALNINCSNSFFNLTNNNKLSTLSSLLQHGLKHIPNSGDLTNAELFHAYSKFKHKILWQSFHSVCLSSDHLNLLEDMDTENYNRKLKNRFIDYNKFPRYLYPHLNKTLINQIKQLKEATIRYSKRFPPNPKIDTLLTQILQIKKEYPEIIFKPADKNIGTVAMTLTQYDKLVMNHLNNTDNYAFISNHEKSLIIFETVKKRLNTLLDEDKSNNNILLTSSEYKFIKSFNNPTIPHFYILPKLHKGIDNLKGRPICSSLNWFTTPIVAFNSKLQYTRKA